MRLLGISGSPSEGSRTVAAIRLVLDEAARLDPDVQPDLLEIRRHDVAFCDGRRPEQYEGGTRAVIDSVVGADAYVVGSPMYRGSYTGILKNLFDLLPNDAMAGKVVGLVATGGSDHHFLALEHQLRPVVSFFRAHTVPGVVYAQNAHFSAGRLVDAEVQAQCSRLAQGILRLSHAVRAADAGPSYPVITRKAGQ